MDIKLQLDYPAIERNNPAKVTLAIGLKAAERPPKVKRDPVAFGLVIDRSGSMQGMPLEKAKNAACKVLGNLRPEDSIAVTTFDNSADTVIPAVQAADLKDGKHKIQSIQPQGCTNLVAGWMLCRDELRQIAPDTRKKILVLTDGLVNQGMTEPDEIADLFITTLRKDKIKTSCLGFGDGYDEDLLLNLAESAQGGFYDANSDEDLGSIFTEELEGLQEVSAQNVRIRFKKLDFCDGGVVLAGPQLTERPDGWYELMMGDLMSLEEQSIYFELDVLAIPAGADGKPVADCLGEKLLEVEILWDQLSEKEIKSMRQQQVVTIDRVQNPDNVSVNEEVILRSARQRASHALRQLRISMDPEKAEVAIKNLESLEKKLTEMATGPEVQEALRAVQATLDMIRHGFYHKGTRAMKSMTAYLGHSYGESSSRALRRARKVEEFWSTVQEEKKRNFGGEAPSTKNKDSKNSE